ncbi:hypothetical protein [Saccharibacillus sacchari]|uniref:Uncharacterized protein n=1 Tax=Saccharibacillus sacchari TaxID=456493 RepID=A0ACC6PAL9_9BACL
MPWPMVHFAVAAATMPEPSAEFLIGSLAPDAVHVRSDDRSDKARTHLMIVEGEFLTDQKLHEIFRTNAERVEADPAFLLYLLGYIAHVYTDRRWTFEIYPGYEKHPEERKQYHREVKAIESMLLQNKPDAQQWLHRLKAGRAFEFGGLSAEDVHTYRDMKLLDLQENSADEPKAALEVLSAARLEQFIRANGQDLRRLFAQWGVTPI